MPNNKNTGSTQENGYAATTIPVEDEDATPIPKMTLKDWVTDFSNLLKAFIGLNFMYISFAFLQAGLIRGIAGLLFITYITYMACLMLVDVSEKPLRV